MAKPNTNQETE